ncbi:MAG: 30S ribosomal protein S21 [Patescibacteria group bacterium]|jgi:ribosomal protein S21
MSINNAVPGEDKAAIQQNGGETMVEFRRKKGESFESFLRRFNRRLVQSGKLLEARAKQRHSGKKSRNLVKKSALIRLKYKSQQEYLRKTGKLKEDDFR